MLRNNRLSWRRAVALAGFAAMGVFMLRPDSIAAAASQTFAVSTANCETQTLETNVSVGGPALWPTFWEGQTTATTNTNLAHTAVGTLAAFTHDYQTPLPCIPGVPTE